MARKFAAKGFVCLLAVMILFTILSRITASLTVARVITEQPSGRTIEHVVTAMGSVEKNLELAVLTEPGLLVKTVYAAEGKKVSAGDLLAELDPEDLDEAIDGIQEELRALQSAYDAQMKNKKTEQQNRQNTLQRAQEDYDQTVSDQEAAVAYAADSLQGARDVYDIYKRACDQGSGSGVENLTVEERIAQLRILEDTVKARQHEYDAALNAQRDALKNAMRSIEDAKMSLDSNLTEDTGQKDLAVKKKELARLTDLKEAGGRVTSPVDGVVTKVDLVTGQRTADTAAVTLADLSSGLRYQANIAKENAGYVSAGDRITLYKGDKDITGLAIETVKVKEDGSLDVSVHLTDDTLSIGDTASLELTKSAGEYPVTVPVSALHEEKGKYFVFVLESKDTVLGEQYFVRKEEVTVEEMNHRYAGLGQGSVSTESLVITDYDRYIEAGSRVRLQTS